MASTDYVAAPKIAIDGRPLGQEFEQRLELTVVDDHLFLPDMFVLAFRDPKREVLKDAGLTIGAKVEISAARLGDDPSDALITGEITSLEAEFDGIGSRAVVRGYDKSHRLHRGRRTETYRDVSDSDLAKKVAQRAGIETGRIDATPTTHPHVSQANLTDWEFLKARAREIGYEVAVREGKLEFRSPTEASDAPSVGDTNSKDPLQLVLGRNLEEFRPRIASAEQVKEVEVRGWDTGQKKALVGRAKAETSSVALDTKPGQLAATFGSPTYVSVDRPLATQAEVDAAAKALAEEIAGACAEAEGIARGDAKLVAGTAISVGQAGRQFEGKYTITSSRHVFDSSGYRTHFVVSGRQERSLLGLASLGATNGSGSASGPRIYGMVIAIVTDVKDPEKLGRVKLKFPWLADEYESYWARVVHAGAGKERGLMILPEVNDEVLVAFEHGDVRFPYVLGGLYNGIDKPFEADKLVDSSSGAVDRRYFRTRLGHLVSIADTKDGGGIVIETAKAKNSLTLDNAKNKITVKSNGDVEVEARGKVRIKAGSQMSLEAGSSLELKAPSIAVKGKSQVDISGGALCKVHASMVKIN
jgi:phage protein D/phage baseplate assembly protein gpV